MGQLMEPETASLEEHLLTCEECRVRLTEMDGYLAAMREALRQRREKLDRE